MIAAAMAARKPLVDKKMLALTGAKFRAWWEGEDFDEAAALAAYEAKLEETPEAANGNADDALFELPAFDLAPRLQALSKLWGQDRLRPGDASSEKLEPARIGIAPEGRLAFVGPGLVGPIAGVASAHPGKIEVFEWRDESFEALKHGVAKANLAERVSVARIDLEAHVWTPASYDGLFSIDDFAYCGHPPHLAQQMMKCLKPGACAVIEAYVGLPSADLATAFAASFAEPNIRAHGDLVQVFKDTGFVLENDEDLTEEFLELARSGFRQLGEALAGAETFDAACARELAWEAEAWRMRLKLLAQRRLERRRFTLRRPAEAGSPEPAPSA